MIQKGGRLFAIDNSGASVLKCIHVCKKSRRPIAYPATVVVVSVRRLRKSIPKKLVKKSKIYFAIITGHSYPQNRISGTTLKGHVNTAIILTKYNKKGAIKNKAGDAPLANRFSGSVFHEVRRAGFIKVIALARGVLLIF